MINLERTLQSFSNYLRTLRKSPKTIENYTYDLKAFFNYLLEQNKSLELSEEDLRFYCFEYLDNLFYYNETNEYKISSLNRKRSCLRKYIKFLYDRRFINDNFANKIEFITQHKKTNKDVLSPEEITDVINILKYRINCSVNYRQLLISTRNKLAFYSFIFTGMRVSELMNVKWVNIDFSKKEIYVEKGKGNKSRNIPLVEGLKKELLEYKEFLSKHYKDEKFLDGYIFHRNERNINIPLTPRTMERLIDSLGDEANIKNKNITPHSLRHTMASYAIRNKISIPVLSDILGHSKSSITMDIYAHIISEQQKKEEMDKLNFG